MATTLRAHTRVARLDRLALRDVGRDRTLPLTVFYPRHDPIAGVVIFSHGLGADKDAYDYLGGAWANAGFVSIHPTHRGTDTPGFSALLVRLFVGLIAPLDFERLLEDRARDAAFVIASLATIAQAAPALAPIASESRIGIAGHSLGAATALVLAGATTQSVSGGRRAYGDERVRSVIACSPFGSGLLGFDASSWTSIRVPALTVCGSDDLSLDERGAAWWREPYDSMRTEHKYHEVIDGARHYTFADADELRLFRALLGYGDTGDSPRHRAQIARTTTAFWQAHLAAQPM